MLIKVQRVPNWIVALMKLLIVDEMKNVGRPQTNFAFYVVRNGRPLRNYVREVRVYFFFGPSFEQ